MSISDTVVKLLTFRLGRQEMLHLNNNHFFFGLLGTWIVGMGRYWDDSGANLMQHLGLGSVIYIFILALFIWLILLPFKIEKWTYFIVLTFISLTSFPAIFYAIPVEKFFSLKVANSINAWFLGIVAAWRLALLYYFLKQFTQLKRGTILTVTLLPISIIISILTLLDLQKPVFEIMGGMREPSSQDTANAVLLIITGLSLILLIPLLISYGIGIYKRRKELSEKK